MLADTFIPISDHDAANIVIALIITLPSIIAAIAALRTHQQVKPQNGRKLADITEENNALGKEGVALGQQIASGDITAAHGNGGVVDVGHTHPHQGDPV